MTQPHPLLHRSLWLLTTALACTLLLTGVGADVLAQKKPDPKALASYSFKLAEAFEAAILETDRAKARYEAANKAAVKLDDVDLSGVFGATKK